MVHIKDSFHGFGNGKMDMFADMFIIKDPFYINIGYILANIRVYIIISIEIK